MLAQFPAPLERGLRPAPPRRAPESGAAGFSGLGDSGAVACVVELDAHAAAVDSVRDRLPALS
ncbi:hypothetical protein AB0H82_14780, partial [Streptomyces sp. NPDC050732]|uniref:hypothetical protein n=1 Tax=Streptomyces sp. NPDC050732 TaxID=3154632 RepID=UPI003437A85E